ncbi:MAG: Asp-tRNA(Asn)/Glu-tRNA(Gln) amidotransferase subunit GatA [Sulfolobales archaeon]
MKVRSLREIRDLCINSFSECEEEVYRVYENIRRYENDLRAYITLRPLKEVLEDLKRSIERRGVLSGVLIAVKDNISTKGIRTTCASKILENYTPPYDATIVLRIKEAGGVIIGKTNLDEFAMGSTNETSYFGVSRNPWNREHVPGGSSGGSAVAVSAYMTHAALGTDTGGSIRNPASYTGITGFKPTYGFVSRFGIIAYASSLDQAGPMTRNVFDASILMDVISGLDPLDPTSVDHDVKSFSSYVEKVDPGFLRGKTLIMIKELWEGVEKDVVTTISSYLNKLSSEGLDVIERSLPEASYALPAYYVIATAEASSNLARYQGILYGLMKDVENTHWSYYMSKVRSEGFGKEVKKRIILGSHVLSVGYYEQYYIKALKIRRILRDKIRDMLRDATAIVSPTTPFPAPKIGDTSKDPMLLYLADMETVIANLIGGPAISIPAGFVRGLPIGIQLTSIPGRDLDLLMLARASELKTGLYNLLPQEAV